MHVQFRSCFINKNFSPRKKEKEKTIPYKLFKEKSSGQQKENFRDIYSEKNKKL